MCPTDEWLNAMAVLWLGDYSSSETKIVNSQHRAIVSDCEGFLCVKSINEYALEYDGAKTQGGNFILLFLSFLFTSNFDSCLQSILKRFKQQQ